MIHHSLIKYEFPPTVVGDFFYNRCLPEYNCYVKHYHYHFLVYLLYLLRGGGGSGYPKGLTFKNLVDEVQTIIDNSSNTNKGNRPIKKILIGEAPPVNGDYFYNPKSKWPNNTPWIKAPMKSMLNGKQYPTKIDFLMDCAREGFLLLDLFPYPINFNNRNNSKYQAACSMAFGYSGNSYPISILNTLKQIIHLINSPFSIGFGMKSFGECILNDLSCIADFNKLFQNHQSLNPSGALDILRTSTSVANSDFLRVCSDKSGNPNASLLKNCGF